MCLSVLFLLSSALPDFAGSGFRSQASGPVYAGKMD